ncbi:MAG: hypothetical protein QHC89_17050, partial [Bosea sp. (in: a-proteobacteria)]|nr:hypothetical protein [Bosea sp. (in: a-proteobacteria)]
MNRPKKLQDPTEAAMSAIEEALRLEQPQGETETPVAAEPRLPATSENDLKLELPRVEPAAAPASPAPGVAAQQQPPQPARAAIAPDTSRVANDDRRDSSTLVQAFAVRPSRKPYWFAALASLAWLGGAAFVLLHRFGSFANGLPEPVASFGIGEWTLLALSIGAPIVFFFVLAALYRRTQEMRLISRAMTEVALRLAEPEVAGADSVLSLSQTIRREVAAMGDGIERAVARAGELETIVRGEISTLERAYADNEIRLRSLIDELVTQREAVVGNAERVKLAISGAHEGIAKDLDGASRTIAEAIAQAGDRVTGSLGAKGDQITQALGRAGEKMIEEISGRSHDLVERLQVTSGEVSERLAGASDNLSTMLDGRAKEIAGSLEKTGIALTEGLTNEAQNVTRAISDTGMQVAETLTARVETV